MTINNSNNENDHNFDILKTQLYYINLDINLFIKPPMCAFIKKKKTFIYIQKEHFWFILLSGFHYWTVILEQHIGVKNFWSETALSDGNIQNVILRIGGYKRMKVKAANVKEVKEENE